MNPSQEKNYLTAEEVCSILKVCGEVRVAKLEFRDLRVEFSPTTGLASPDGSAPVDYRVVTPADMVLSPLPEAEISELQKKVAEKSFVQDEIATREDQIAELLVTDPLAAERLLMAGKLEEQEDDSDDLGI